MDTICDIRIESEQKMKIIGRIHEQTLLKEYLNSTMPEFVAVYGRRRVGKTFLINEFFQEDFTFSFTGFAKECKKNQIHNFYTALKKYGTNIDVPSDNWYDAFEDLITHLSKNLKKGRKSVIFMDELPWLDTPKSGFLAALEHFWNGWAASKPEILLIACGSATSWMMNKLIRNKGGLHNRVTRRMCIQPFTLGETAEYLLYREIDLEHRDVAMLYMVFGGVPFYLNQIRRGKSVAQNIDELCFAKDAIMRDEFDLLFDSLFARPARHRKIIEVLSAHQSGMMREKLLAQTGLTTGGTASQTLDELEQCGFIEKFNDYSGRKGRYIYQLVDFFTLFYFRFMNGKKGLSPEYWSKSLGSGAQNAWAGLSFEKLCLLHINEIQRKLGISGILTVIFAWKSTAEPKGAQIDLLIDRVDNIINVCECKFVNAPYEIDKTYDENLRNKVAVFKKEVKTNKAVHITMITTYGIRQNKYAGAVQSEVILDDLFG
ncbi:MAG: AAA family ATPase [Clostridiales Family XIII bacterium]|jgi:AAA+ ATPase superfamily predicted ATPase|nr:AAA family ATPase [Clostridiales Family XIII bacterium]